MHPAHVDLTKRPGLAKMGMTAESTGTVTLDMTHQRLLDCVRCVRTDMPVDTGDGIIGSGVRTLSIDGHIRTSSSPNLLLCEVMM